MAAPMTLSDLPEDVLLLIMSSLRPTDLARLCAQDRRLRAVVSGSTHTWRPRAEQRWPLVGGADQYRGEVSASSSSSSSSSSSTPSPWYTLYREREAAARALGGKAASSLGAEADRLRMLVARQVKKEGGARHGGGSGGNVGGGNNNNTSTHNASDSSVDQLMRCVFALGTLRAALVKSSKGQQTTSGDRLPATPDLKAAEDALALWLCSRPEAAIAYARDTAGIVSGFGGVLWGAGAEGNNNDDDNSAAAAAALEDALRRRSAVQFLLDWFPRLVASCSAAVAATSTAADSPTPASPPLLLCPSVAARLQQEATWVDARLRPQAAAATSSSSRRPPLLMRSPPAGVPLTHGWWWWVSRPPRQVVVGGGGGACGVQAAAVAAGGGGGGVSAFGAAAVAQQQQRSHSHANHPRHYHDF